MPEWLEGTQMITRSRRRQLLALPTLNDNNLLNLPRLCHLCCAGILEALAAPTSGLPAHTRCGALRALCAAARRCGGRTPLGEELAGFLSVSRGAGALSSSLFSDAALLAGEASFSVSRAVLSARCPVLLRGAAPLASCGSDGSAGAGNGLLSPQPQHIRMGPSVPPEALHLLLQWAYTGSCVLPDAPAAADQLRRLAKATGLQALSALARAGCAGTGGCPHARRTDVPADISADFGRLLVLPPLGGAPQSGADSASAGDFPAFWDIRLLRNQPASSACRGAAVACRDDGIGAHRVVLVARSQYLRALLSPGAFRDASGSDVIFPEISTLGALRALRRWLYTDEDPWGAQLPVAAAEGAEGAEGRAAALETALEAVEVNGARLCPRVTLWLRAVPLTPYPRLPCPAAAAQVRMLGELARFSEEHFARCAQALPPRDVLRLLAASAAAGCWSMASGAAMSAARDFNSLRVDGALDELPQARCALLLRVLPCSLEGCAPAASWMRRDGSCRPCASR